MKTKREMRHARNGGYSETPTIGSTVVLTAASKRKSVVFSNEASISTESFILAIPKLVQKREIGVDKRHEENVWR